MPNDLLPSYGLYLLPSGALPGTIISDRLTWVEFGNSPAYSLIGNKLSGQFHRAISESVKVKLVKLTNDPGVSENR